MVCLEARYKLQFISATGGKGVPAKKYDIAQSAPLICNFKFVICNFPLSYKIDFDSPVIRAYEAQLVLQLAEYKIFIIGIIRFKITWYIFCLVSGLIVIFRKVIEKIFL